MFMIINRPTSYKTKLCALTSFAFLLSNPVVEMIFCGNQHCATNTVNGDELELNITLGYPGLCKNYCG